MNVSFIVLFSVLFIIGLSTENKVEDTSSRFISIDQLSSFEINVVLSDIDGTLANDDHTVTQQSVDSIRSIKESGLPFFIATARNRKSALKLVGPPLIEVLAGGKAEEWSGVFNQGLEVYGEKGVLIHSRHIEQDIVSMTVDFGQQHNIAVIASVDHDDFLCDELTDRVKNVVKFSIPMPTVFEGGLNSLKEHNITVSKMLLFPDHGYLRAIRPSIDALFEGKASVTSSTEGLIEILPLGASKGEGVKILLQHYDLSLDNAVAFGDNENDIGMLQSVRLGIAVDNAVPHLKEVANAITYSNNNHGVAEVLDMIVNERLASKLLPVV
jgi:Cof subfamily protein (haloacid dehalogenase superfamily)